MKTKGLPMYIAHRRLVRVPLWGREGSDPASVVVGWALVNQADEHLVAPYRWNMGNGYAQSRVGLMHRMLCRGPKREGAVVVDHINRIKTDNRRKNLRWVTVRENNNNRGGESTARYSWIETIPADSPTLLSPTEVHRMLVEAVAEAGSQATFSRRHNLESSTVSRIIQECDLFEKRVLDAIGVERVRKIGFPIHGFRRRVVPEARFEAIPVLTDGQDA